MNDITAEAKIFVQNRLRAWLDIFPGLQLRYYFEPCSDAHVVEVKPESIHYNNEQMIKAQLALIRDVEQRFPEHGMIYFTESDSKDLLGSGTIEIHSSHSTIPQQ